MNDLVPAIIYTQKVSNLSLSKKKANIGRKNILIIISNIIYLLLYKKFFFIIKTLLL